MANYLCSTIKFTIEYFISIQTLNNNKNKFCFKGTYEAKQLRIHEYCERTINSHPLHEANASATRRISFHHWWWMSSNQRSAAPHHR